MHYYDNVLGLIGHTPLVKLNKLTRDIKALGTREGIPVITLAPDLQAFAQQNNVFLHGFGENIGNGHWNVAGNRVAGELIAKKLCEEPLLK